MWSWLIFDVGQDMKHFARIAFLSALLPSVAFAHGEQIIAFPIGMFAALFAVAIAAFVLRLKARQRVILIVAPLLGAPAIFILPGFFFYVGEHFGYGLAPWFVIGAGSVSAIAALIVLGFRWQHSGPNKALEPTPTSVTSPAAQEPRQL